MTYQILLFIIFGSAVVTFTVLLFFTAPYGRYARRGWGPTIKAQAAWIIMELPAVAVILLMALSSTSHSFMPVFFLILWQIHYVYRTFLYPALMQKADKEFPLMLVLMALIFNSANGFVNGWHLFRSGFVYEPRWSFDPRFIGGLIMYLAGFLVHVKSDAALRTLRRRNGTEYGIPRGGIFTLISAPNYFGEIVQWFGWAIATWSVAGLAFAVFTAANLLPRALSHHNWYKKTFNDYPEKRKAVIPFIL